MTGEGARAPFPWREAMAFGLGVLRLSARDFWRMTPHELAAAVEGVRGRRPRTEAPPRRVVAALIDAFPDEAPGMAGRDTGGPAG